MPTSPDSSYLLVTPAFNESQYIEATIQSVVAQTIKPRQWIIVDDGSTDNTADVVMGYVEQYNWITCLTRDKPQNEPYFASNVNAIMYGVRNTHLTSYEFLAILDADIILPEDYYERITDFFYQDKKLGVASGIYENMILGKLYPVLSDRRSTPKAIQVFRRDVFETIGGYLPLKYGGEDTCACVMARMKGWKAWSFSTLKVIHCRPTGLGSSRNRLAARFKQGLAEYSIGSHPIFVILKSFKRSFRERPYVVGGLLRLIGFSWAYCRAECRQVDNSFVIAIRREQLSRFVPWRKWAQI